MRLNTLYGIVEVVVIMSNSTLMLYLYTFSFPYKLNEANRWSENEGLNMRLVCKTWAVRESGL